jgi:hypothetical protein
VEEWRSRSDRGFLVARGDFDGDGKMDEASLVLSKDGRHLALVVALSASRERVLSLGEGDRPLLRMGIVTVPPGRYRTACGKGYRDCKADEPEELVLRFDAIDYFYEESADGVYYLTDRTAEFRWVALSD